jgi:hypothetical protein
MLADLLRSNVTNEMDFIGHIGGDDFTVIMKGQVVDDFYDMLQKQFEIKVLDYYHPMDIKNGYITTENRRGETELFPLLTMTVIATDNHIQQFKDIYELTQLLAREKKKIKLEKMEQFNCIEQFK